MSIVMGASAIKGKGSPKVEKHLKTWAAQLNLHPDEMLGHVQSAAPLTSAISNLGIADEQHSNAQHARSSPASDFWRGTNFLAVMTC